MLDWLQQRIKTLNTDNENTMASLNNCSFTARLGRDPDTRHTQSGTVVCNFSIAVSQYGRDRDGNEKPPIWLKVVCFGGLAENVAKYCRKGSEVAVAGALTMETYIDKNTRQEREAWGLNANSVTFIGGKQDGGDTANQSSVEEF